MRIAVLANLKVNAPERDDAPPDRWDELDSTRTTDGIMAAVRARGHEAAFFEASLLPPHNLIERLTAYQPDLCFNIAEGHDGDGREAQIPALLEMLRIPYTGSQVLTLAVALDKGMTKKVLRYHSLPTPEFQVVEAADAPLSADLIDGEGRLRFPLFVKPIREGSSIGVSAASVCATAAQAREQIAAQWARYRQPVLVERYVRGRDVTLGLLGNHGGLTFLPPLETDPTPHLDTEGDVYTHRRKHELADDYLYHCPARISPEQTAELNRLAERAFDALGCKDVARVDFRLDADDGDRPFILEINPLAGLNPGYSDLCLITDSAGMPYVELINRIVGAAAERYGLTT